jgi:alkane 1-monooxygenase
MRKEFYYLAAFTPSVIVLIGNLFGGHYALLNMFYSLGLLIILDFFAPSDHSSQGYKSYIWPERILLLTPIVHFVCILTLLIGVYNGILQGRAIWFAAISTGLNAGMLGITAAHEFIHRKEKWYQYVGIFSLFIVLYTHFYIEHRKGHHARVGTLADPATARYNESFYAFLPRSVFGQWWSALQIEAMRLKRINRWTYGLQNFVVRAAMFQIILIALLYFFAGSGVLWAFLVQAIVAIILLEYVNYIEHYGIVRADGERIAEHHAWQSDTLLSRFFLFELSRHAHHHIDAQVPFSALTTYEKGRFLPKGYFGMFYIGLIPPLWFRVVNPLCQGYTPKSHS